MVRQALASAKRSVWGPQAAELISVLCICVISTGAYAVYAGQDANWDQRNYHFYSVHAWLHGRTETDLAPGQVQTWINPLPHVPQYWLIRNLSPVGAGFGMGMLAGINGVLLWILTRRLLGGERSRFALWCAALVTLTGMTGSIYVSYVGTTFAEYLSSSLILAALIALLPLDRSYGTWSVSPLLLCGFNLGLASGAKLTNVVFAMGMLATLLILWPVMKFRLRGLLAFAIGGLVGFLVCGSFWAMKLWVTLGNPMFPFFNTVFESPLFDLVNIEDTRFPPKSLLYAAVTYPFVWFLGMHPTSEVPFREARFALVAVLVPFAMMVSLLRQHPSGTGNAALPNARPVTFWLLGLFFLFSYAIWLKQFGVQRYALPLELLAGAVALLSLIQLLWNRKQVAVVFGVLSILTILWTRPADWGRVPYGDDWFGVAVTTPSSQGSLYLMLSGEPISYAIPFMSPKDRFVRLDGNLPLEPQAPLGRRAVEIIARQTGPIRTLSIGSLSQDDRARLRRFGLIARSECQTFRSRLDIFVSCGVERAP